jgi:hypothetical protein
MKLKQGVPPTLGNTSLRDPVANRLRPTARARALNQSDLAPSGRLEGETNSGLPVHEVVPLVVV